MPAGADPLTPIFKAPKMMGRPVPTGAGIPVLIPWSYPGVVAPAATDPFPRTYIPHPAGGSIVRVVVLVEAADPTNAYSVDIRIGGTTQATIVLPANQTSAEIDDTAFTDPTIANDSTTVHPALQAQAAGTAENMSILVIYEPN